MIPALGVRGDQQTARGRQTHPRQTRFAVVLNAIAVPVVEHLAQNVGAVEVRVGDHPHRGLGQVGDDLIDDRVHRKGDVGVFALDHARADHQDQLQTLGLARREGQVVPGQQAAVLDRLNRRAVDAGAALAIAEAGRRAIRQSHAGHRPGQRIASRDDVRDQTAAHDVDHRGRLGDFDRPLQDRVQRNVVVDDIGRDARRQVQRQDIAGRHRAGGAVLSCARRRRPVAGRDQHGVRRRMDRQRPDAWRQDAGRLDRVVAAIGRRHRQGVDACRSRIKQLEVIQPEGVDGLARGARAAQQMLGRIEAGGTVDLDHRALHRGPADSVIDDAPGIQRQGLLRDGGAGLQSNARQFTVLQRRAARVRGRDDAVDEGRAGLVRTCAAVGRIVLRMAEANRIARTRRHAGEGVAAVGAGTDRVHQHVIQE